MRVRCGLARQHYHFWTMKVTVGGSLRIILFEMRIQSMFVPMIFHSDLYKIPTHPPSPPQSTALPTTQSIIVAPQKGSKHIGLNEPKVSSQKMSSISQNETRIEEMAIPLNDSSPPPEVNEATVDVSLEMIYMILIGKGCAKANWRSWIISKYADFILVFLFCFRLQWSLQQR